MKRAKILSASAGSGKTYQLALRYMCDIIEHPEHYRNILAVTFTNKATEEMKSRILSEIHILASGAKSNYLDNIIRELGMSEAMIRERALKARTRILHDFSRFSVLTIDRFFQRILRAFIKELSLDLNYNIELDATLLLERSADALVESITSDEEVKRWLLEFAEERITDGSRWDMRGELCKLGAELFQENGAKQINTSQSKTDIHKAVNAVIKESERSKAKIKELGEQALRIMNDYGVVISDFKGKSRSFVSCFTLYANGELKPPTDTMLKAAEDSEAWYGKDALGGVIAAAEKLRPILCEIIDNINEAIKLAGTAQILKANYRSFALLADLQRNITRICDEENMMILSKTKDILSEFVDDSNAPFIYEKVGNRYDHYMIDEFQDTSVREWRNMLPLLKEALASNSNASVFIVGDIKQSIYRWRGGDWRLLNSGAIDDLGRNNTEVIPLQNNYRSLENIITFNNRLIESVVDSDNANLNRLITTALGEKKISQTTYDSLYNILLNAYADHHQEVVKKSEDKGYVEVCTFDSAYTDSPFIEAIESAVERGYKYRDILILVRKGADAERIANILFEYKSRRFTSVGEAGFNILLPDKLTLEGCDIVEFVISLLRLAINPKSDIERGVYNRFLGYSLDHEFSAEEFDLLHRIVHLAPAEAFELIVSHFKLYDHKHNIAFLQALHEQIISFSETRVVDIQHYLEWWDERGKKESIKVEMTDDTIEITTVHKAKGLERDIVIIPYARFELEPSPNLSPIVWSEAKDSTIGGFPALYGKPMEASSFSEDYYRERVMSHVDGINLLYVALTRASRELYLYIPSGLNGKARGERTASTTPLIMSAIPQICEPLERVTEDDVTLVERYRYGALTNGHNRQHKSTTTEYMLLDDYITTQPNIKVRYPIARYMDGNTAVGASLRAGIRLHRIFEHATNEADLHDAVRRMVLDCSISEDEAIMLKENIDTALSSPIIREWFSGEWDDVKMEADIIYQNHLRRPDRVMIKGERAVVVDYKFGEQHSPRYARQVREYMALLDKMGLYRDIEGYIWYIMSGEVESVTL